MGYLLLISRWHQHARPCANPHFAGGLSEYRGSGADDHRLPLNQSVVGSNPATRDFGSECSSAAEHPKITGDHNHA